MSAGNKLTDGVGSAIDVAHSVSNSRHEISAREQVQGRVVKHGDVTSDDSSGEQTNVLESILLSSLGTNDGLLGGYLGVSRGLRYSRLVDRLTLVNALVTLGLARVSTRVLVVEFAERRGVNVWRDAEQPCCRDGVEGEIAGQIENVGHFGGIAIVKVDDLFVIALDAQCQVVKAIDMLIEGMDSSLFIIVVMR